MKNIPIDWIKQSINLTLKLKIMEKRNSHHKINNRHSVYTPSHLYTYICLITFTDAHFMSYGLFFRFDTSPSI